MSNTIPSVFSFKSAEVRTVVIDDEPWFIATDVCSVLGMKNHREAIRHLDNDERGVISNDTPGGIQQISIINESGLYALVLRSRKPEAKPFIKWVTKEVLPAIRKTGQYISAPYSANPGDTLTKEDADMIRELITRHAETLPKELRASFVIKAWAKLKSHFKVGYRQIPSSEFTEAVCLIGRHIVEGEYLPRQEPDPKPQKTATPEELIAAWLGPNGYMFDDEFIFRLAQVCNERIWRSREYYKGVATGKPVRVSFAPDFPAHARAAKPLI